MDVKDILRGGHGLRDAARDLIADERRARGAVQEAVAPLRAEKARAQLAGIPLARLKDVTGGRLRLGPLENAGYATVGDVLDSTPYRLQALPGVGPQTAAQLHAAARQIADAAERAAPVTIGDEPDRALLVALHRVVTAGPDLARARGVAERVDEELSPLLADARPASRWWLRLVAGRARRERADAAVAEIAALLRREDESRLLLAQTSVDLLRPEAGPDEARIDYELRAAEYQTALAEIAALVPDGDAAEGHLTDDLARRVRAQPLDTARLRVALRGYQEFGAKFALAQERVILGDEMGLGKTVQALAVAAHLAERGRERVLVACPASVLINWLREIETHTTLTPHPVHGPGRAGALRAWAAKGGVAVTTLDTLHALPPHPLDLLVVDEAHYAKNPATRRAGAVRAWCGDAGRVLFLTGTPMENRVEEFRTLVEYLRPELLPDIRHSDAAMGPRAFRAAVGPAYLRRNQQDVLVELPDVVRVDEWEEFSAADARHYRDAVRDGAFMAMRRAAYADVKRSAKLRRLAELVEEAAENERKVVIFSFFRDVLDAVRLTVGRDAHGPITGSVPAADRQAVVDAFAREPGHAVLLAQIQAGGTGLNLQAASVVILCEPQVKPTLEAQAVGRAHRMGQTRSVQVHRLLTPDSVDQRMLEILRLKQGLFDEYARRSDLAESTPDALDISEALLAATIVSEEQERLG
ncbi:DEAD/DEAH box helicase [Actinomadura flavalba]|uniref:DEAD/DEAH box helicase n=1 Tax=Actinomadura flavalba TaxID=1120938 RepID=UPI0003622D39|nr:DEAD/DEAH box helicase [Actinomadura flavalba]